MDIESLADFIELAKLKSFSKAAASRHVTQPAFSRRIQALETIVATALIDRTSKNFQLTPAGERFLVHAKQLVGVANRAIDETRSLTTRLQQPVYISAPSYLSKTFFPAWYKEMQRAIPGLALKISNQRGSGAIDDLHKGLADFALLMHAPKVMGCYDFGSLQKCVVGKDGILAVRSRHLKSGNDLLMHEQGSYMSACADAVLGNRASKGSAVFESASTGLLKEMALAGFGTAVLPESLVADDLAQGYLVPDEKARKIKADILLVRAATAISKKSEKLWLANIGK
jgi:LysR family transcriptional regulator, hypochlorite-specific transcription factor HypT